MPVQLFSRGLATIKFFQNSVLPLHHSQNKSAPTDWHQGLAASPIIQTNSGQTNDHRSNRGRPLDRVSDVRPDTGQLAAMPSHHVLSCSPKVHVATPDNRRHRLSLSKQYLSLVESLPRLLFQSQPFRRGLISFGCNSQRTN